MKKSSQTSSATKELQICPFLWLLLHFSHLLHFAELNKFWHHTDRDISWVRACGRARDWGSPVWVVGCVLRAGPPQSCLSPAGRVRRREPCRWCQGPRRPGGPGGWPGGSRSAGAPWGSSGQPAHWRHITRLTWRWLAAHIRYGHVCQTSHVTLRVMFPRTGHPDGLAGGQRVCWAGDRPCRSASVEQAGVNAGLHPGVDHQGLPVCGGAGCLGSADWVQSLHTRVVTLQGLADVLGVSVGHTVHVEVAEAGRHQQDQLHREVSVMVLNIYCNTSIAMTVQWTDTNTSPDNVSATERKMENNQMRTVPFKMLVL